MRHFIGLLEAVHHKLPDIRREWFYPAVLTLMRDNLERVKGDIDWLWVCLITDR